MFTRAIVRSPAANFFQALTTSDLGAPDYERALAQHEAYCSVLEQCGLSLTRLEADERYPDSCFVEDAAVVIPQVTPSLTIGLPPRVQRGPEGAECRAVLTRPGAPSRAGEIAAMRKVLADFFPTLSEIQSPGTLDGGDICEAGRHFFIGVSSRTNEAGAQQLAEMLAPVGYSFSFVDIRTGNEMKSVPGADRGPRAGSPRGVVVATGSILHLKSAMSYLDDNRLVVTDALVERPEFAGYDLIRVPADEEYAANCIRVNDHVLLAAGHPGFETKLRALGYHTIALQMSEFQKMDGGLSCLSLRF